jgi:hypothetical protein
VVDGRRVEHCARPRSGRRHRQGEGVIGQEGHCSVEGRQGHEIAEKGGEEGDEKAESVNQFLPYSVDMKFAPIWLPIGVRPSKDGVTITDDGRFRATFGFLRLETPSTM